MYVCIYIYICISWRSAAAFGMGDDAVGNPHRAQLFHRAQILQFDRFELILLLKLDKQFPVERFEASRAIRGSRISVSSTPPSYTTISTTSANTKTRTTTITTTTTATTNYHYYYTCIYIYTHTHTYKLYIYIYICIYSSTLPPSYASRRGQTSRTAGAREREHPLRATNNNNNNDNNSNNELLL